MEIAAARHPVRAAQAAATKRAGNSRADVGRHFRDRARHHARDRADAGGNPVGEGEDRGVDLVMDAIAKQPKIAGRAREPSIVHRPPRRSGAERPRRAEHTYGRSEPGQDIGVRWQSDDTMGVGVREHAARRRQAIEQWRRGARVAGKPHGVRAQSVYGDEQDIGPGGSEGSRNSCRRRGSGALAGR